MKKEKITKFKNPKKIPKSKNQKNHYKVIANQKYIKIYQKLLSQQLCPHPEVHPDQRVHYDHKPVKKKDHNTGNYHRQSFCKAISS